MRTFIRSHRMLLVGLGFGLAAAVAAYAYTVTQSYDPVTKQYTYTVVVGTGETPVRDFHVVPPKGSHMKGSQLTPVSGPTGGTLSADNNWTPVGGSAHATWYTSAANAIGPGNTIVFGITADKNADVGSCLFYVTTNGEASPPKTGGTQTPGPVAAVTPSGGSTTPAPNSAQAVTLASTEGGTNWQVYLAASVSTDDPATDPLGIGLNTNDPIPSAYGVAATPSTGVFPESPPEGLVNSQCQLSVGAAPIGYRFYLVLVGIKDGEIDLFSAPREYVVTAN